MQQVDGHNLNKGTNNIEHIDPLSFLINFLNKKLKPLQTIQIFDKPFHKNVTKKS